MDPSRRFRCGLSTCSCARRKFVSGKTRIELDAESPRGSVVVGIQRQGLPSTHKELDSKTYDGASTSDGHRLPTSATNAPRSRPGPARRVTGTKREFSTATHALLTPSSGFSKARTVIATVAPGSSEPLDGAASTQAGNEEKAHDCIASDSFFKTNWTSLTVSDKDAWAGSRHNPLSGEGTFTEEACAPPRSLTHRIDKAKAQCTGRWSEARNRASPRS